MNNGLNIYKCSGVVSPFSYRVGEVEDENQPYYSNWLADTKDFENTRSYNYLLSLCNGKIIEINSIAGNTANKMNDLDLYVISLYALDLSGKNSADLARAGRILSTMQKEGMFSSTSTNDDERAENLNNLFTLFKEFFYNGSDYVVSDENDVTVAFFDYLIENNYNHLTVEQKQRFETFFSESKVGAVEPLYNGKSFTDYVTNSGIYYLYIFIPDSEIGQYSKTIQDKRKKELELFEWCVKNCYDLYTREGVYQKIYNGVTVYYRMKPENKIKQLKELGQESVYMGALSTTVILAIISLVAAVVTAVINCIKEVLTAKYKVPENVNYGTPTEDDYGLSKKTDTQKVVEQVTSFVKSKGIYIAAAVGLIFILKNRD